MMMIIMILVRLPSRQKLNLLEQMKPSPQVCINRMNLRSKNPQQSWQLHINNPTPLQQWCHKALYQLHHPKLQHLNLLLQSRSLRLILNHFHLASRAAHRQLSNYAWRLNLDTLIETTNMNKFSLFRVKPLKEVGMPLTQMMLLLVDRSSISAMASSAKVRKMSEDPDTSLELLRMVSMVSDLLSRVLILL